MARSPCAGRRSSRGYWKDPEATAAAFTADGWYRTGDIGELDASGSLRLIGRAKDMFALPNGMNVHPEDVENALEAQGLVEPVVFEIAPGTIAYRVSSRCRVQRPAGRRAGALSAAQKSANAHLAPHQRIAGRVAWPDPDYPRTHTRKIQRSAVARRLAGAQLSR